MKAFRNPRGSVVHAVIPGTVAAYCGAWLETPRWLSDRAVSCKTCLKRMPKHKRFAVLDVAKTEPKEQPDA